MANCMNVLLYFQVEMAHCSLSCFPRLQEIEKTYNDCGYSAKFFKETAVSNQDGTAQFFTDQKMEHLEWGSGIVQSNNNLKSSKGTVRTVRLARYVNYFRRLKT